MTRSRLAPIAAVAILLLPLKVLAQTPAPMMPASPTTPARSFERVIEVSGDGEAQAAPDLATLQVAIETHGATADRAAGLNGALAQKVHDALKSKLGDKGRMWTGGYSLFPEYSEPRNGRPTITGYRAENSISIETGQLELVGPLIDAAIGAGANQVNSMNYSLRDSSKVRREAIAKAAHDAQAQAQGLADAIGVKLGPVIKASTESEARPEPIAMGRLMSAGPMAAPPPTPIEAGLITIPATVSLTYGIE
ncbi:MAG TPA: SIMPL domain-containing protein [Candidatus Binataceae bacterium]|nr:SIMPL domain-containing protein [Candidatus Binataceae bacterium]